MKLQDWAYQRGLYGPGCGRPWGPASAMSLLSPMSRPDVVTDSCSIRLMTRVAAQSHMPMSGRAQIFHLVALLPY